MEQKLQAGKVAVVGLGLAGVATVKNLREAGYDVIGIERSESIGGLWTWSDMPDRTTVTRRTVANISKQCSCYQDFPFPDEVPNYPKGSEIEEYINAYADHFGIRDLFKLGVTVQKIARSADGQQWSLHSRSKDGSVTEECFDRIVVTNGPFQKAVIPKIEGSELFKGEMLHAQNFKNVERFTGKRVMVVGLGNTGGDTAVDVSKVAAKTWMSHRSGAIIVSRGAPDDKPTDHRVSRRMVMVGQTFHSVLPSLASKVGTFAASKMMTRKHKLDPAWKLLPAPPIGNAGAVANEYIIQSFEDGTITPVTGIKRFLTGENSKSSVELTDGEIIENVDAIIFCTGYQTDYSIFAPEADPTAFPTPEWDNAKHSNGLKYPRLYQGIFSTKYPLSLAFIGPYRGHSFAAFSNADLSSQAIAQVWAGNFNLPPQEEIEAWCDENYRAALKQIEVWRIAKVASNPKRLEAWLNDAAGNQVNEKLGWGWEGWKFWWNEYELYKLVMDGINSPCLYRLFDGRPGSRQKWIGAREAIYKANGKAMRL